MDGGFEPQVSIDDDHSHQKVNSLTEMVSGNFGCAHYRRRCKIRAPCCDQIFDCRHCHNEAKNSLEVDPLDRHDVPRHDVKRIICSLCNKEQDVQQLCIQCGVCMGNYFCSKCKFFDDDVSKKQYHCDECGICRLDFFLHFCKSFFIDKSLHVSKSVLIVFTELEVGRIFSTVTNVSNLDISIYILGCCYSNALKDSHNCVEKAMHHNCPVCFEVKFGGYHVQVLREIWKVNILSNKLMTFSLFFKIWIYIEAPSSVRQLTSVFVQFLFDTREDITVLRCGHTIHLECVKEMQRHFQYSCPVCSKSFRDMSRVWEKLDEEVAGTLMPLKYLNKMVWILCNDCGEISEVNFHIVGHKCLKCKSYNTRRTRGGPASCSSRITATMR
ncbi:hypothetical protein DVH24_004715 [Malus domestica]|uniref:CHY-type domain-containing protein n=1 Tax=Malus domestica TaxID=3750 RepID=A0A498IH04_MALDO|nr:hypothetical protein DVH24_004715 [Malus domestica]